MSGIDEWRKWPPKGGADILSIKCEYLKKQTGVRSCVKCVAILPIVIICISYVHV